MGLFLRYYQHDTAAPLLIPDVDNQEPQETSGFHVAEVSFDSEACQFHLDFWWQDSLGGKLEDPRLSDAQMVFAMEGTHCIQTPQEVASIILEVFGEPWAQDYFGAGHYYEAYIASEIQMLSAVWSGLCVRRQQMD